jgi:hypothetical protein
MVLCFGDVDLNEHCLATEVPVSAETGNAIGFSIAHDLAQNLQRAAVG